MKNGILFSQRLLRLRKQAGLSQKKLGEVIGLSNKAVCTLENGTRETTFEKLVLLAEYFQVSTDYLLGITEDPTWRGDPAIPEDGPHSLELTQSLEPQGPASIEAPEPDCREEGVSG